MHSITQKLGVPPALPSVKNSHSMRDLSVKITVSTPMVGGGVEAGIIDEQRPIRVPSIRGHLRYWWRMMNLNTPGKDARESKIWGSTESPGKVYADVPEQPNVLLRYYDNNFDFKERFGPEAYALFASRQNRQNIARENFTFTLNLRCLEKFHDDVRLALSAWIYFGGLGARTRRGCGSLSCSNVPVSLHEILKAAPHITLWRKNSSGNNPLSAWSYAVKRYMDYRQNRNKGQGNRPGRSRWPEADSLRQITGKSADKHSIPITSLLPSFPRAALGLPIIFQFSPQDRRYEPDGIQLIPKAKDSNRMASPVITKALCENSTWYSAVIILPHDDIFDVPLELSGVNREYNIPSRRGIIYKNTNPMQGQPDAISGFEEFIAGDFIKEGTK